jgi:hypothetical protein
MAALLADSSYVDDLISDSERGKTTIEPPAVLFLSLDRIYRFKP